jgi:hemerythrin-like domain-containing protein
MTLDLETRTGWPAELRLLIDRYPRAVWPGHANLGELARFWLDIHDGFRDMARTLGEATVDLREGRVTHDRFRSWFAPRLRMFLHHLEGHHQIEDFQFFPLFGAAEPRLRTGFDVLENDHHVIHGAMDTLVETANAFLNVPVNDSDPLRRSGDRYADASDHLMHLLARHLDDEEDLIVPLILDRGEQNLNL